MMADGKIFSYNEVSLHNSLNDCWVIVNAKAYNVTGFLREHPGGDAVLLAAAGKDASEEFEDAGHGSAARLMLDEFYVGEIDPATYPSTPAAIHTSAEHPKDEKIKPFQLPVKLLQYLAPLTFVGLAVSIHFSTRSS